jgi:ABC-type transport system involved in cytochrome c biogenesis permease subunit
LPSLERLEGISHVAIEIGLPLVVAGIVVGFAFQAIYDRLAGMWYVEPSVVLTTVTALVFAGLLWAIHSRRLRGARAASVVVAGFVLVVVVLALGGHTTPAG